jgi:hypothetical protein
MATYACVVTDSKTLALCLLSLTILQSDSLHTDEAGCVAGGKIANLIHRALASIVQLLRLGRTAEGDERTLIDSASDLAINALLAGGNSVLEELTLRR